MHKRLALFLLLVACCQTVLFAGSGKQKYKFGDVKPEDFAPSAYAVDSSADAVYLYDIGSSSYEGNNKGFFSVVFKRHARIRLLHRNAFDHAAAVSIDLYKKSQTEEKLEDLQVATFNLENGVVTTTKLDKSALFEDKNGDFVTEKFTFPNIREGSIIEYSYTVTSPRYYDVPSWFYQGEFPRLFSQYEVTIPTLFDFVFVKQGYHPYSTDTALLSSESYLLVDPGHTATEASTSFTWRGNTVNSVWAMKNVPALKDESFTTTLRNHISSISFQLAAIRWPNREPELYMSNWGKMVEDLLKDEDFGADLAARNAWLNDEMKNIVAPGDSPSQKARKIYAYLRDQFACVSHYGFYLTQPLKKTFQQKKGSVADINMLLTAMLRNQGIGADPVILSTRSHGLAMETYPIMNKFNYLICKAQTEDSTWLLDASYNYLGFNMLDHECYNGSGRTIANPPVLVELSTDSLIERQTATIFLVNDTTGKVSGSINSSPGIFHSMQMRSQLKNKMQADFFRNIQKSYSMDVELTNEGVDSLNQLDCPLSYHYDIAFAFNEDLVYFTPILGDMLYKENPFKASTRTYPVEMDNCIDKMYVLNMEVPKGYKVEELPKSNRVNLNDNEGSFEYIIGTDGENIQMRCHLKLQKANFEPDDYDTLRDFFAFIVKKEKEQIVFKKIKS
ncbi:DUF3857 domain-containing protein [Deminuibacter soli]|uniref:DUF3857 domain-containing protein n=1 Tax=Deminuibacter soli TaxID=2291815 RepID=A0A3E1NEX9_9BACT|nr:DUF3857 domain-containing protein [Deminuibacter soli]RFM26536.1 DUF3857 domain-containing protein [Deminuibacter soli]